MPIYRSSSSENTKKFASALAKDILVQGPRRKGATVIALQGELGAGKTTFTQGFFKGLGVKRIPASPTFILMRRTALRGRPFRNVYHIDAYRAKDPEDLSVLGLNELFQDPENLFLIEWPERIKKILPRGTRTIRFAHGKDMDSRTIRH